MYTDNLMVAPAPMFQNPQFPTPRELVQSMVLLEVMHYDFTGTIKNGQIIIHELVTPQVREFFKEAFLLRFPIHQVVPVARFNWCDISSCRANNSSGQNLRYLDDGRMSKHGIGCAFDINPQQNPCFVLDENTTELELKQIIPFNGIYRPGTAGTLQKGHPLVEMMVSSGWSWGGNWIFPKDYQHFQIVPFELEHYVT